MAKRRRRRKRRENLTEEEIRRLKIKKKKRLMKIRRRRFYFILFICFMILIFVSFAKVRKAKNSVSDNSVSENTSALPSAGGTDGTEGIGGYTKEGNAEEDMQDFYQNMSSNSVYEYSDGLINLSVPLDIYSGRYAINPDSLSGNNISKLGTIKAAMATQAYFTGSDININTAFNDYGKGEWHGICGVDGSMTVFYEGEKTSNEIIEDVSGNSVVVEGNPISFKIIFTVYDDGQFILAGAAEDGVNIEDYGSYVRKIIGK